MYACTYRAPAEPTSPRLLGEALRLAREAWDDFFECQRALFAGERNPDYRNDLALDRTLRALGRRPRPPRTKADEAAELLALEVRWYFLSTSRLPNYGQDRDQCRIAELRTYSGVQILDARGKKR